MILSSRGLSEVLLGGNLSTVGRICRRNFGTAFLAKRGFFPESFGIAGRNGCTCGRNCGGCQSLYQRISRRFFGGYDGQHVESEQLIKKSDDWIIEETNFCLGRVAPIRFKETDDMAHRVLHIMDCQLVKMHTRLRDGTCIPVMAMYVPDILEKPTPSHPLAEPALLKYTWDETYSEAYEDPSNNK